MALTSELRSRIESVIGSAPVVLFMKGTREVPQCGFSKAMVGVLDDLLSEYETVDVLSDGAIREGIKEFSSWPTIPQLYIRGEFVGGSDIVREMAATGELHEKLGVERPQEKAPEFALTAAAAAEIQAAIERMKVPAGYGLRLRVDARGRNEIGFDQPGAGDHVLTSNGVRVVLDRGTASRIDGLELDAVRGPDGLGFRLGPPGGHHDHDDHGHDHDHDHHDHDHHHGRDHDHDHDHDHGHAQGAPVRQISPAELEQLLSGGIRLIDVRTPQENAVARIAGARLLDDALFDELLELDRSTPLAFHCHHGGRSQSAAEHFAGLGFATVYNLAGGIDAWSQDVDPNVPRY